MRNTFNKKQGSFWLSLCVSTLLSPIAWGATCDEDCMIKIAEQYMEDVVAQDWSTLPWADQVRFTENNVAMMIGDGFWGAVSDSNKDALILADEETGNVLWYGITGEHGDLAYYGMRLKIENGEITEVETYLGREGQPDLFSPTKDYRLHPMYQDNLRNNQKSSKERMIGLVEGYYNSKVQNDGQLFTNIDDNCARIGNGVNVTHGNHWPLQGIEGCKAQLEAGVYKPVERIRGRRFPIVDVDSGVVVALSLEDHAARFVDYQTNDGQDLTVEIEYPNTRAFLELFKIVNGEIVRIEGISVFSPYYIESLW